MLNRLEIIGRLGKNPEVRHLESGSTVATFSVATSERYKDRNTGEKKENTEWHYVVLWKGLAEVAEKYLKKGDLVYISGKVQTRSYEHEGVTKYITELVGRELNMLSPKGSQSSSPAPPPSEPEQWKPNQENEADDDLPF